MELELTPWIWRVADDYSVTAHTGAPARAQRCIVDEHGRVYLETDIGFGLVHSLDMLHVANAIESGLWVPETQSADAMPTRFGYITSPEAANAANPA